MEAKPLDTKTDSASDAKPSANVKSSTKTVKTSRRATRYVFVGIGITIFNYILFAVLSNLIIKNNELLWLSNLIATAITTIVAYIAHSKITWRERQVNKSAIYRFFIWNIILTVAIAPAFTQLFSLLAPLYELAYNICTSIHLPFSYEFILTTGSFAFTSLVIMVLNFLFYDRFVFGKNNPSPHKVKQHGTQANIESKQ